MIMITNLLKNSKPKNQNTERRKRETKKWRGKKNAHRKIEKIYILIYSNMIKTQSDKRNEELAETRKKKLNLIG